MSYNAFWRAGAHPARETQKSNHNVNRSLAARWGSDALLAEGFVAVPVPLLRLYSRLGLSNSELVFVVELMSFKWNEDAPFPSYKTLAQRMNITPEMARRHAKSLEEKGLLKRVKRTGRSNAFDVQPLSAALESILKDRQRAGKEAA